MKKYIAGLLAIVMLLGSTMNVLATEMKSYDDKPYLALGADLTADEQHTVLGLLGIPVEELEKYEVVYVTNAEEHKYLDAYIPSEKIGTRALSSVLVSESEEGSGITIETHNITYCTKGMYENALTTAGIKDARIVVAGPFDISGTAALLGVFEAYEEMSGESLDEKVIDASMDELVTTGELESSIDADPEVIESMLAELKEMLADGKLKTEDDIRAAIAEMEVRYGIELKEDEIKQVVALIQKFGKLNLDWLSDVVHSDEVKEKAGSFIDKIIAFFRNLFS